MFFPKDPIARLDPLRLLAVRFSLNSPMVEVENLPSGPARAAIVVYRDEDEEHALQIWVRGESPEPLVAYGLAGELERGREIETAVDAALTFAEGMGFLFEDELLRGGEDDRRTASRRLAQFRGIEPPPEPVRVSAPQPARQPAKAARPASKPTAEAAPPLSRPPQAAAAKRPTTSGVEAPTGLAPPAEMPLTKFRRPRDAGPASGVVLKTAHGPAVGRVRLVKRRRAAPTSERPGLLARLLGAF